MKKKIFALALAAVMLVSGAMTAMAATTTVDCPGWWKAHSQGFEVTKDGVEVTFKATTNADASSNWNTPIVVVYAADAAFAGSTKTDGTDTVNTVAGYKEYAVLRSDNYAWAPAGVNGVTGDVNTGVALANWEAAGYKIESEGVPADNTAWATWLTANKAGVDCKLTAKLSGSNAIVTLVNNGLKATITVPVESGKTIYVSLGGELCKLTNIKTVEKAPENPDVPAKGDMSSVMTYVVLFVGAALVVVAARKRFA